MSETSPTLSKAIAAEIRAELARKQLDAKALGPVLGLSKNTIYSRVNGQSDFTTSEITKAAAFFGVTEYELLMTARNTAARAA